MTLKYEAKRDGPEMQTTEEKEKRNFLKASKSRRIWREKLERRRKDEKEKKICFFLESRSMLSSSSSFLTTLRHVRCVTTVCATTTNDEGFLSTHRHVVKKGKVDSLFLP